MDGEKGLGMQDWAELKRLAEAATSGPWVPDGEYVNEHGHVLYAYVAHADGGRIGEAFANCLVKTDEQCRANAEFMAAANPKVVLALLTELEALSRDAQRYRWLRDECHLFEHYRKAKGHVAKFDDEIDAAMIKGGKHNG